MRKVAGLLFLGTLFVIPLGCMSQAVLVPSGTAAVKASSSYFSQNDIDFPADALAPTSLADLDGCWGAYVDYSQFGVISSRQYEFYKFDAEQGIVRWEVLAEYHLLGRVVIIATYDAQIESNRLVLIPTSLFTAAEFSSMTETHGDEELSELGSETHDLKLAGDLFRFTNDAKDNLQEPLRGELVFRRFDCPDE